MSPSPSPESRSLLDQLAEEITWTWQEAEPQYVTEFSTSAPLATVTSAMAGSSVADLGGDEDELLDKDLLGDEDNLGDEDGPTIDEILNMDVDRLGSDDDVSEEWFSHLAVERTVEPRPFLETTTHLKANLRQEVHSPKATSFSEEAADQTEDLGTEFRHNVGKHCLQRRYRNLLQLSPGLFQCQRVGLRRPQRWRSPYPYLPSQSVWSCLPNWQGVPTCQNPHTRGEGLTRGKLLAKPRSKMDLYRVSKSTYHFGPAVLDAMSVGQIWCRYRGPFSSIWRWTRGC